MTFALHGLVLGNSFPPILVAFRGFGDGFEPEYIIIVALSRTRLEVCGV